MRMTKYFVPTARETPSEAETASHVLMLRAGMIRKVAAGVYDLLPLGLRVIRRVENIVRDEMNRAGALETLLPSMIPAELWMETGRWQKYGKELLRIKDRHGHDFCYGPTHEEVMTDLVRGEVRSYKQLPLVLYQIQTKFRDEIRPRFGMMRAREFMMKDAYGFHPDEASAAEGYARMFAAYENIFRRSGLKFRAVEADTGNIGGSSSHEFMVLADTGEDTVVSCPDCSYASNLEKAESKDRVAENPASILPLERGGAGGASPTDVETPNQKTIEEVSAFLKMPPERFIKTLVYCLDEGKEHLAVLVRGDCEVNEHKLKTALGADSVELASFEKVRELTGAGAGFVGPRGLKMKIVADHLLRGITNAASGANKDGFHTINLSEGRDFKPDVWIDARNARAGDLCARCGKGRLDFHRGIEVGHVFRLGTKYSKAMNASYLDADGKERTMVMGTYGVGIGRIAAAAIEQSHDQAGIVWPYSIAPFHVVILPLNVAKPDLAQTAERIYSELSGAGFDVLLDDRDERAGFKFNDADLVGIPIQVIVGEKGLKNGEVEIKVRKTAARFSVKLEGVGPKIREIADGLLS
ncbi:MAG: proline--tRNA ligase [Nitrospinae bacterium]|nr:proline--tRNA ligase [Nitrospinota bacterium]